MSASTSSTPTAPTASDIPMWEYYYYRPAPVIRMEQIFPFLDLESVSRPQAEHRSVKGPLLGWAHDHDDNDGCWHKLYQPGAEAEKKCERSGLCHHESTMRQLRCGHWYCRNCLVLKAEEGMEFLLGEGGDQLFLTPEARRAVADTALNLFEPRHLGYARLMFQKRADVVRLWNHVGWACCGHVVPFEDFLSLPGVDLSFCVRLWRAWTILLGELNVWAAIAELRDRKRRSEAILGALLASGFPGCPFWACMVWDDPLGSWVWPTVNPVVTDTPEPWGHIPRLATPPD